MECDGMYLRPVRVRERDMSIYRRRSLELPSLHLDAAGAFSSAFQEADDMRRQVRSTALEIHKKGQVGSESQRGISATTAWRQDPLRYAAQNKSPIPIHFAHPQKTSTYESRRRHAQPGSFSMRILFLMWRRGQNQSHSRL